MVETTPPNTMRDPVMFEVELKEKADIYSIKRDMELLESNLIIFAHDCENLGIQRVSGSTDQKTYESVFGTKLAYESKIIPNLNKGSREVWEWVEKKPARVSGNLQDRVNYIRLAKQIHLTD